MVPRVGLTVLVLTALAGSSSPAVACTCMQPGPACQAYWTTDAVFDGSVTSITPIERTEATGGRVFIPEFIVRFDVRQAWKGVPTGPLEILTTDSGGLCGFEFHVGRRYLVFSHRRGFDGRLAASRCSLTREYNGLNNDVTPFLASLTAPPPAGGRVFGTVTVGNTLFSAGPPKPMAVPVRLTGDGRTVAVTSTGGHYEFKDLKPARYEIDITLPQGYISHGFPRAVNIPEPRACAKEDAWVKAAGVILGRVVGPTGPAGSVRIEIAEADAKPNEYGDWPSVRGMTRPDGSFQFEDFPPGRYIVGVNLRGTPTPSNRYERVLYPGAGREAEVIALALGQTVDLGTLQIPAPARVIKVSGVVTWPDGSLATNILVMAQDLGPDGRAPAGVGVRSGADGRFTIGLIEGRTYTFATPHYGPRDQVQLTVTPFRVQESMAPVHVVIPRDPRRPSP